MHVLIVVAAATALSLVAQRMRRPEPRNPLGTPGQTGDAGHISVPTEPPPLPPVSFSPLSPLPLPAISAPPALNSGEPAPVFRSPANYAPPDPVAPINLVELVIAANQAPSFSESLAAVEKEVSSTPWTGPGLWPGPYELQDDAPPKAIELVPPVPHMPPAWEPLIFPISKSEAEIYVEEKSPHSFELMENA